MDACGTQFRYKAADWKLGIRAGGGEAVVMPSVNRELPRRWGLYERRAPEKKYLSQTCRPPVAVMAVT